MKDRTWLIVTIVMGMALVISLGYSLKLRKKINEQVDVIVSRSIVQITASNVSIKNVVTVKGKTEKISNNQLEEEIQNNTLEINSNNNQEDEKDQIYISINLKEDTTKKVRIGQEVDIEIKKENEILKYKGKILKVDSKDLETQKAIVEFNCNETIKENQEAKCSIIVEEANNVIALPLRAIKTRKLENNNENITNNQNQSNITNDTSLSGLPENKTKEEKYVIVVNDDGTTSDVVVETGISDEYYVEIVSGLSEGQKVQIEEE